MNKKFFWLGVMTFTLVGSFTVLGQNARVDAGIKAIPINARNTANFAPPGWTVNNEVTGDLDGDNIPDAALTLTIPFEVLEQERGSEGRTYDSTPCIVVL